MRKLSKLVAVFTAACLSASAVALSGCEGQTEIYFLNFKPEIADKYAAIAEQYEKETGVKVKIATAASGEYEKTLATQMADAGTAPTIFQINGPIGYQNWKGYCIDLKNTILYSFLVDKSLAVTDGDGVYGVPYAVEGYGFIYNNAIMDKYFKSDKKTTKFNSMNEVNNYDKFKSVVEDMTKMKSDLGINGVFASTSLKTGDDWRWQTHLFDVPLYYEFKDGADTPLQNCLNAESFEFKYAENYKNIFDLYLNNSGTEKTQLGSKTVDESMSEFALGNVAMVQNGNWAWAQIKNAKGTVVKEEDIKYLPIYTGMQGEETQGLCVGTENYFAINAQVDESKQKASIEFLEWLFSSDYGKNAVLNELGFICPFTTFKEDEKPSDPLAKEVLAWMERSDVTSVPWTFQGIPSEKWKQDFGANLLTYAQGQTQWNEVVDKAKTSWQTEVSLKNK